MDSVLFWAFLTFTLISPSVEVSIDLLGLAFGFPIRREKIDSLTNPVQVKSWDDNYLILADDKRVRLPGITRLPLKSAILTEAIKRGVEVTSDGRVYGLIRVWHWCGNDPVTFQLARVDLSEVLFFFGQGEPQLIAGYDSPVCKLTGAIRIGKWGLDAGQFHAFEECRKEIHLPMGPPESKM